MLGNCWSNNISLNIHADQKFSEKLITFINGFKFNSDNLNAVNFNGVTPLTLALEQNKTEIVSELLEVGANPLVENIHGNSPLSLAKTKSKDLLDTITLAICAYTCKSLDYQIGAKICYLNKNYVILKTIQAGAGCLGAMEIFDIDGKQKYFAKIKKHVGGFESRNYMAHDQYVDLIKIEKFSIKTPRSIDWNQVYCLIQQYINGKTLSQALIESIDYTEKQEIIKQAINSLANLHQQGYVHQDPLPDNCIWDPEKHKVILVDYESMRKISDFNGNSAFFAIKVAIDFGKLIVGFESEDGKFIPGLRCYIDNIESFIKYSKDLLISEEIKNNLLEELHSTKSVTLKLTL